MAKGFFAPLLDQLEIMLSGKAIDSDDFDRDWFVDSCNLVATAEAFVTKIAKSSLWQNVRNDGVRN